MARARGTLSERVRGARRAGVRARAPRLPHAFTPRILPRVSVSLRVIRNTRPRLDWNTCAQAAVATVLVHFRAGPFTEGAPDDATAVDLIRATHPPDAPFAMGTSADRVAAALVAHGLSVERVHSGFVGWDFPRAWDRLSRHVAEGHPAIVCVDEGLLGGLPWVAHWAVATSVGERGVVLADRAEEPVSLERFLSAWHCRILPFGHNHAAILARPPR